MGIAQLSDNELVGLMSAAGAPLANSVAATSLLTAQGKFVLRAGWLAIGKKIKIKAAGSISWQTTAVSGIPDIRFGATTVFGGGAVPANSAVGTTAAAQKSWKMEVEMYCRAIGAAANFISLGYLSSMFVLGSGASLTSGNMTCDLPFNAPPAPGAVFDSTVAQTIDLFWTWGAANADNTITCAMFDVNLYN